MTIKILFRCLAFDIHEEIRDLGGIDTLFNLMEHQNTTIQCWSSSLLENLLIRRPLDYYNVIVKNPVYMERLIEWSGIGMDNVIILLYFQKNHMFL